MNSLGREDHRWKTTEGTGDFVFAEAEKRRRYAARCAEVFRSWGYSEVITPTVEYFASLAPGIDSGLGKQLFRFFDCDGKLLALRPEMTTPIARVVGTQLAERAVPLRCYYVADVYRNEPPQATHRRQFLQAGIELIGVQDRLADAEVISVVIETLQTLGLSRFTVGIGHIDFLQGFFQECDLSSDCEHRIREALKSKNLVLLDRLLRNSSISESKRQSLREIPFLIGDREVLNRAEELVENRRSRQALHILHELHKIAAKAKLESYINFDLGMIKDFNYYTGLVLEAYTQNIGSSLCTGGRYDNLIGHFGRNLPAVGFALGLERIFLALERNGHRAEKEERTMIRIFYTPGADGDVLELARKIRSRGFCAAIIGSHNPETEGEWTGAEDRPEILLRHEGDGLNVQTGRGFKRKTAPEILPRDDFLELLGGAE